MPDLEDFEGMTLDQFDSAYGTDVGYRADPPAPVAAAPLAAAPTTDSASPANTTGVIHHEKPIYTGRNGGLGSPENYGQIRRKMRKYGMGDRSRYHRPSEYMQHLDERPSWYNVNARRARTWEKRARDAGMYGNEVSSGKYVTDKQKRLPEEYHTGLFREERGGRRVGLRGSILTLKDRLKQKYANS